MKMRIQILAILLLLATNVACSGRAEKTEIPVEKAIQVAKNYAASQKYSWKEETAVEVIKIKNGVEQGPLRITLLMNSFPRDKVPEFVKKELWFVYIYPKKGSVLGGDYCVLVDLYTGGVIAANAGM